MLKSMLKLGSDYLTTQEKQQTFVVTVQASTQVYMAGKQVVFVLWLDVHFVCLNRVESW